MIQNSISLLVRSLESHSEPALQAMAKVRWDTIEEVGDASSYVTAVCTILVVTSHVSRGVTLLRVTLLRVTPFRVTHSLGWLGVFFTLPLSHIFSLNTYLLYCIVVLSTLSILS